MSEESDAHVQAVLQMLDFGKDPVPGGGNAGNPGAAPNAVSLAQLPVGMTIQQYQQMARPQQPQQQPQTLPASGNSPSATPQQVKTIQPQAPGMPSQIQVASVPQMQLPSGVQFAAVQQGPGGAVQLLPIQALQQQQQAVQLMQVPQGVQVVQLANGQQVQIPATQTLQLAALGQQGGQTVQLANQYPQFALPQLQFAQMPQQVQGLTAQQLQGLTAQQLQGITAQQLQQAHGAGSPTQTQSQQSALAQVAQQQARLAQPQFVQLPQQALVSPQFAQLPGGFALSQPGYQMVQTPQGLALMQIPHTQLAQQLAPQLAPQMVAGRFPAVQQHQQGVQKMPPQAQTKGKVPAPVNVKKPDNAVKLNPNAAAFVPKVPASPATKSLPATSPAGAEAGAGAATVISCPICSESVLNSNVLRSHTKAKHADVLQTSDKLPAELPESNPPQSELRKAVEEYINSKCRGGSASCLELLQHLEHNFHDIYTAEVAEQQTHTFFELLKKLGCQTFVYSEAIVEDLKLIPSVAEPWESRVALSPAPQFSAQDALRSAEGSA